MKKNIFFFLLSISQISFGQYPLKSHPVSTQSEEGYATCKDTFTIFKRHFFYDIGMMLPSWQPVISPKYVAVLEGKVTYNHVDGSDGPHVFEEDLPFYHYSHDVNFDIIPDKTDDDRYTNLLPLLVYHKTTGNDTVLHQAVHCEWECGLAMANLVNPLRAENDMGKSGGFFSAGHEMGDVIWNWPSPGDWAHVEGFYHWDRGHPPSESELHPLRFAAFKRNLAERIIIGDSSVKFSTRVDIFASGDGGALFNNRYNSKPFVKRVNMSSKDYEFNVKIDLPRPAPTAHLRYVLSVHKGDNFSASQIIEMNDDSGTAHILIPWKSENANDLEIYARTINFYWDEGTGVGGNEIVDIYKVRLNNIHFRRLDEFLTKAEIRMFANVGSDWIFVNDFFPKKGKILTKGLGKTYKHNWALSNEFIVCVPRGKTFRVNLSGWEVDGVDMLFGKIIDPGSPCNRKTKNYFKTTSFTATMFIRGCLDDYWGETTKLHSYEQLGKVDHFTNSPQNGVNDDPCLFGRYPLKDRVFLSYTIEKMN